MTGERSRRGKLGTIGTRLAARVGLGRHAEGVAERYLRQQGYRILGRNLRTRMGELDLACFDGPTLVFVEVRSVASLGGPERAIDAVTFRKAQQVVRAAQAWLATRQGRRLAERDIRMDVVGVDLRSGKIDHLKDAIRLRACQENWR